MMLEQKKRKERLNKSFAELSTFHQQLKLAINVYLALIIEMSR
jgi:hypothetical protein